VSDVSAGAKVSPKACTMTDEKIALRALMEKGSDATFLREMIGFAAQRLMELETDGLCGAAHGEPTDGRRNHRNGYRDRDWETRAGTVELRIPKLRRGRSYEEANSGGALPDCSSHKHLWRQACPLQPTVPKRRLQFA
jgi:Transposase, Mutator family